MAKKEKLNAKYEYNGEGELLSDISSTKPLEYVCEKCNKKYKTISGLIKHSKTCVENEEIIEKVVEKIETPKIVEPIKQVTKQEMYQNMILEGDFILKINGNLIFDTEVNNIMLLSFGDDGFWIGTEKFPYQGLNFKYKK